MTERSDFNWEKLTWREKWQAVGNWAKWAEAIEAAEGCDDKGKRGPGSIDKLVSLLRAEEFQKTPRMLALLAALLDRSQLRPKRGSQPKPLFQMTAKQKYADAVEEVESAISGRYLPLVATKIAGGRKNVSFDEILRLRCNHTFSETEAEAIKFVAAARGMDAGKLKRVFDGKTGFNRAKKRPAKSRID